MARAFPPEAEWLIRQVLGSVESLEILLLLRANPSRTWTGETVSDELRSNADSSSRWLARFAQHGLVETTDGTYRWDPPQRERAAADVLAAEYAERRFAVIDRILSRGSDPVRDFAEAFRLREKEEP